MAADATPAVHPPAARWRRPDALELELATSVGSRYREAEEFGWELWEGRIWAMWDVEHWTEVRCAGEELPLPPEHGAGWEGADLEGWSTTCACRSGHLERWTRVLDPDVGTLLEAADAIATDLINLIEAIAGDDDDPQFCSLDESSDTRPCRCAAFSSASRVQRRGAERVVAVPTIGADADHCWTDRRGVRLVSAPAARGMVAPSHRVNRTRGSPRCWCRSSSAARRKEMPANLAALKQRLEIG
jgi:hypothetical protein